MHAEEKKPSFQLKIKMKKALQDFYASDYLQKIPSEVKLPIRQPLSENSMFMET